MASVNCGPILTICTSGAISMPRKIVNVIKVPSVIVPARIFCAPRNMITALTRPISTVDERLIRRRHRERFDHVVEQALDTAGEHFAFSFFRVVALHHANAAEGFGEAAGDFCI